MKSRTPAPKLPPEIEAPFRALNPKEQQHTVALFDLLSRTLEEVAKGNKKYEEWGIAIKELLAPLEPESRQNIKKVLDAFWVIVQDIVGHEKVKKAKKAGV